MIATVKRTLYVSLAFAALTAGALAAPASGYVYWTDELNDTVGRAGLDGSSPTPALIGGLSNPCGVDVDGASIYWGQMSTASIGRAELDGGAPNQAALAAPGIDCPGAIAVDGSFAYWSTEDPLGIGRVGLDGSGASSLFVDTPSGSCGVEVNATHVFWTDLDGRVGRANIDGSNQDDTILNANNTPCGVAVDATHLYYADIADGTIGRANIDGSPAEDGFINVANQPCDVAVNETHIYWANRGTGSIGRANIDGTGANPNFITGLGEPCGIALDAEPEPPETAITAKPRKKTRKRSATFQFVSDEPASTFECQLDRGPFSPCSSPHRLRKLKRRKHTFQVRAIDAAANVDPTPALRKWKIRPRR
jgi:hypothetical protein